jgi:hypothetical protein
LGDRGRDRTEFQVENPRVSLRMRHFAQMSGSAVTVGSSSSFLSLPVSMLLSVNYRCMLCSSNSSI